MKKNFTVKSKLWKVMKMCAIQVMIATVCGVSLAHTNYGQLLERKVTLSLTNVPLEQALNELEREANVQIFYSVDKLGLNAKISLDAAGQSLREVLDELLEPHSIKYKVYEKESTIVLKRQHKNQDKGEVDQVESAVSMGDKNDASTIAGSVTDGVTRQPMAGVNVVIKGTTVGTTTDSDGNYSISAQEGDILVFSFIGYKSIEVRSDGRTVLDVILQEDIKSLNEVEVNAGYWVVKEREQTGNISRITAKEIKNQSVVNPLAAMIGRMPGVSITQLTGVPGDGFRVQIRGRNSMRGGTANDPLYIVDGVPFSSASLTFPSSVAVTSPSPLNAINPADIESIEVLKDADATAIYGSRGANGVVLITTKKGKEGKTKLDLDFNAGVGQVTRLMSYLNTEQYVQMRKEAFQNDGVVPTMANAPDLLLWDTTRYTDWQRELIGGSADVLNASASVSGGTQKNNFIFSSSYNRQGTVYPGNFAYQKGSSHFNFRHASPNDKFNMNLALNLVADRNNLPVTDLTGLTLTLPPNAPAVYDENGNLNWENGTWSNPFAGMKRKYEGKTTNLIANVALAYMVLPGLTLKTDIGYSTQNMREKLLTTIASQNPANNPQGSSTTSATNVTTWNIEPQVDYQSTIAGGKLSVLAGTTFQQSLRDMRAIRAFGYTDDTQLENIEAASGIFSAGVQYIQYRYTAIFGRVNYNWREKLILNITARRDGSSRFGPDKRFANFGAIGAAWIFSNESFVKENLSFLSYGKVRSSYGTTGSDQIGDYQYLDTHTSTSYTYQSVKGLIPTRLLNADYAWEVNKKAEAALELGFFQDRLLISNSYYLNRTSNQLLGYTLPAITGFSSVQSNLPATVQNWGWELEISSSNIHTNNFKWSSSVNLSLPRNRLVEFPNIEGSPYANVYKVGEPLFVQKKYTSNGVDDQTGLYSFVDVNGDGILSPTSDARFIKGKAIDFFGGFQNNITFKGFELDFLFQFVKQKGANYLETAFMVPGSRSNQPDLVLDRWQKPGDQTSIQKYTQTSPGSTAYINARVWGDNILSDASFIRLKNVALSWNLPDAWSRKANITGAKLYCLGQNLWTFTNYQGADPETQSLQTLPPMRIITFGVQVSL